MMELLLIVSLPYFTGEEAKGGEICIKGKTQTLKFLSKEYTLTL